ncbi:hypothetical protein LCGC14_0919820 [marine sediment metagenome]|uniref:Uncharacterized protein n=1 Tax=marine sediment metagenome TaxID=412755 RepID=A0A0F9PBS3_9ZZZZ
MCIRQLLESNNVSRMTGNPTSQEAWLRTRLLSVLGDYAQLVAEVRDLAEPVTMTIDKGEDAGEYTLRKGIPIRMRKKLNKLADMALDMAQDITRLPKSSELYLASRTAQGRR